MPDGTARITDAFARAAPGCDAVTVSEALWLAAVLPEVLGTADNDQSPRVTTGLGAGSENEDVDHVPQPTASADDRPRMYDKGSRTGPGIPVARTAIGTGRALPSPLDLARALRPFKRQWATGRRLHLDLDASVDAYARTGNLSPVLGPAPERWLEAAIVVDNSAGMTPWQGTAAEVVRLFDHTGMFRTVRRWNIVATEQGGAIQSLSGRQVTPRELLVPDGRRLIVVLSDFSSIFWLDAELWSALRIWALHGPTALLSPLPPRLWRRTAMNLPTTRVRSRRPGGANGELDFEAPPSAEPDNRGPHHADPHSDSQTPGLESPHRRSWTPVPAVSLAPQAVARWARTTMHSGTENCDALLLPPGGRLSRREAAGDRAPLPVARRLAGFLTTAPDPAIHLAVLCTPFQEIGFPLLNLLRYAVDTEVSTTDVAEVVLSGLFTVGFDAGGNPLLSLHDEARAGLASRLSKRDVWRSYEAVSRAVESFKALPNKSSVAVDDTRGVEAVPDDARPFADAYQNLLVVLGNSPAQGPGQRAVEGRDKEQPDEDGSTVIRDRGGRSDSLEPASPTSKTADDPRPTRTPALVGVHESTRPGPDHRPLFRETDYRSAFYLSYAHTPRVFKDGPEPNYWVRQFYRDLCNELVSCDARWHRPPGLPGFMDDTFSEGEQWRRRLAEELATCRVFVPLYSRPYFSSENCGREWATFRARQMAHVAQTGTPNEAILPVLWQRPRPEDLPEFVAALQLDHLGMGGEYYERGLYELIRLDRDRGYTNAVIRLAERLDELARTAAPPPGPLVDFENVPPLFPVAPDADRSVRRLRITVAAPDLRSLPPGRDSVFYGPRPEDWRPYAPEGSAPLAQRAADVARGLGYEPIISALTSASPETTPSEAGETPMGSSDEPGVLLVDPWLANADGGAARIIEVDRQRKPWVRVLVPWSATDVQTTQQAKTLLPALQAMIPWSLGEWQRHASAATRDLGSLAEFGHAMPDVVELAWRNYLKAMRPVNPRAFPPRPRLRGSVGPDRQEADDDS